MTGFSTSRPFEAHLSKQEDLVTTYEARRAGFLKLVLEKNRLATHHVEAARSLKAYASAASTPAELMSIPEIAGALVTAAGISDKARRHLSDEDKRLAVQELIRNHLDPAGAFFVDELVYRFLLTRGDALGGSLRNLGGLVALRKLTGSLIGSLSISSRSYQWLGGSLLSWLPQPQDGVAHDEEIKGLSWTAAGKARTLLYNVWVPAVKANVDFCLLNSSPAEMRTASAKKAVLQEPQSYIALGELKGGIDPAGADEHWKTAASALKRIQDGFASITPGPLLFFVGAAIEAKMAGEIWRQLQSGQLHNAANLTDDDQVASLCNWIIGL